VYRDAVEADHPLGYWRLDESSGTSAADREHANNGSYIGSPVLGLPGALVGDPDSAVSFNGATQYVNVPYAAALNPSAFSVEVWVRPTGGAGISRGVMASRLYPKGWVLYAGSDNTWQFWVNDGTGMLTVSGGAVSLHTWTYLVGTFDGTTARLFVNGVLADSGTVTSYQPQTTNPLAIGQGEPGSGFFFPGSIDEPAVYGSALAASQVQSHFLLPAVRPEVTVIPPSSSPVTTPTALSSIVLTPTAVVTPTPPTWYVSRNGNNSTGTSWATAWNELSAIKWNSIRPGDRIVIDGGPLACSSPFNASSTAPYDFPSPKPGQLGSNCGMLYNTTLAVGTSGTASAPITIQLSEEVGHNGTVVVFGGRTSSLPACTQPTYTSTTSGNVLTNGITVGAHSYITIEGTKRSGIVIYGAETGVDINSTSASFITLENLEIFDNGTFAKGTNGWSTDSPGIWMSGHDLTFSRLLIHDNGQDDIADESLGGVGQANVKVTDSWLYFSRENPYQPGWGFNTGNNQPCTHPDGIQTWDGGTQTNFTVQNTIFGPYLGQGFYPADSGTGARWNNVTLSNVLFLNVWYDSINADALTTRGWKIENITSYKWGTAPDGTSGTHLDGIRGTGHSLTNSIIVNGSNDSSLTGVNGSGNIYYNTDSIPGGTGVDPLFVKVLSRGTPHWSDFQVVDLTALCQICVGKGATLHTLHDILDRIDSLN
jgi:hypothetical protein